MNKGLTDYIYKAGLPATMALLSVSAYLNQDIYFAVVSAVASFVFMVDAIREGYKEAKKYEDKYYNALSEKSDLKDYKRVLEALNHDVVTVDLKIRDGNTVEMNMKTGEDNDYII